MFFQYGGSKLKRVETLILQDRLHDASKVLFSHGICKPTPALFDRLQALHPPLKEEIPAISVPVPQLLLTNDDVYKAVYKKCTEHWDSMDPFGWNTALLHLIRNAKGSDAAVDPAVRDAGVRALCLRNASRNDPKCRVQQPRP